MENEKTFSQILEEKLERNDVSRDLPSPKIKVHSRAEPIFSGDLFLSISNSIGNRTAYEPNQKLIFESIRSFLRPELFSPEEEFITTETEVQAPQQQVPLLEIGLSVVEMDQLSTSGKLALQQIIALGALLPEEGKIELKKLKKEYRMLAKKYHPDLSGESNQVENFLNLQQAYSIISDEVADLIS